MMEIMYDIPSIKGAKKVIITESVVTGQREARDHPRRPEKDGLEVAVAHEAACCKKHEIFMVPLKDLVVFPRMVVPFFVGRRRSVRSVEEAARLGRPLFLVAQKKTAVEEPGEHDVHAVGTIARVLQMMKLPDGKIRLLVEGLERAAIGRYTETKDCFRVDGAAAARNHPEITRAVSALMRTALSPVHPVQRDLQEGAAGGGHGHRGGGRAGRAGGPHCRESSPEDRAEAGDPLHGGHDGRGWRGAPPSWPRRSRCSAWSRRSPARSARKLEKTQKDYFLNEQLKEIQRELGTEGDDPTGARELEEKLKAKGLPAEVAEKCQKELKRLGRMQPMSPESALLRTYLEWIVGPAVEGGNRGQPGHRARPGDPGRGPLRSEKGQGADPRFHCRAPAQEPGEGTHPLLHRPPGHGQDLPWQVRGAVPGQELRARVPGRRPGRGGDPRPPEDVRRRAARARSSSPCARPAHATPFSSWTRSTR